MASFGNYILIVMLTVITLQATRSTTMEHFDDSKILSPSRSSLMEPLAPLAVSSIASLCLDSQPDGAAILTETTGGVEGEILTLFKGDSLWLEPIGDLSIIFEKNANDPEPLFTVANKIIAQQAFPAFPYAPDYVISFTGMNKTSEFYNNILVFKENNLYRYQVNELELYNANIKASLISRHITNGWNRLPYPNDIRFMKIHRGSRVLAFEHLWGIGVSSLYVLNGANLDNPIEYPIIDYGRFGGMLPNAPDTNIYYELGDNQPLTFLSTGQWCLGESCKQLRNYVKCEPQIDAFANGFAYWVWQSTEMNFRLIMIGLVSIMVINFILALSFMYNQVKRIADLT